MRKSKRKATRLQYRLAYLLVTWLQVSALNGGENDASNKTSDSPARKAAVRTGGTVAESLPQWTFSEALAKNEAEILASPELSNAVRDHLQTLRTLKRRGVERLAFFFEFLDHADTNVAANAHLEFALASNDDFVAFCRRLMPNQIRSLVAKPDNPDYQTRLYLAMLAQCGGTSDGDWLQSQLATHNGRPTLAQWLAAYLVLKGERGLDFVDREYLAKSASDRAQFIQTYSALSALRCVRDHPLIRKERLAQSTRLLLDNPLLQDLAIHELAHQKDWASVDRVAEVFKSPGIEWSRMSAVNFLRVCPTDEAKQALLEAAKLDPAVMKRAQLFFPDSAITERRQQQPPAQPIRPIGRGGKFGC